MAERFQNAVVTEQKSAGHSLNVAGRETDKVAFEPGHEHAIDAFAVEILAQFSAAKPEGVIKFAIGIGKARQIVQFVGSEEFSGALFGANVNKGNAGSFGLQFRTNFG